MRTLSCNTVICSFILSLSPSSTKERNLKSQRLEVLTNKNEKKIFFSSDIVELHSTIVFPSPFVQLSSKFSFGSTCRRIYTEDLGPKMIRVC